jgi:hypothetical protein
MNYEKNVKKAVDVFAKNWVILSVSTLVVLALGCLTLGLLFGPLMAGQAAMFLKAKSGKKPVFNDLFQFNGKFVGMAIMGLLTGLGVILGCFFLFLPGLLLATLWMYSLYAMAFDDEGITESMKTSWAMVMKHGIWQQLVVLLGIGIFNSLGGAIVVGTLVTIPLSMGFLAMLYEENK